MANIAFFHDLPAYCAEYEHDHYNTHHGHYTTTSKSSSESLGLNIIFLIEGVLCIWFSVMHLLAVIYAHVGSGQYKSERHSFDMLTFWFFGVYFLFSSAVKFGLMIEIAVTCEDAFWKPMTAASLNITFLSFFGWCALAVIIAAVLIAAVIILFVVISPFYLIYISFRDGCCFDRLYSTVETTVSDEEMNRDE